MIKTTTEKRADVRIFAGSDPAHTATATSGISAATPGDVMALPYEDFVAIMLAEAEERKQCYGNGGR